MGNYKDVSDRQQKLIDLAFDHFRATGFPYPKLESYELWDKFYEVCDIESKISHPQVSLFDEFAVTEIEVRHQGIDVANYFHRHIWDSHAVGMRSPIASYNIDKYLLRSVWLALTHEGGINPVTVLRMLRIVSGTQMCSNFQPLAAKAVYKKLYRGTGPILDPSSGYGGRLLGFLTSGLDTHYLGVDPSTKSCAANEEMAEFFELSDKASQVCSPFEDVDLSIYPKFDMAFTSPPYFKKEYYSDEKTQSHTRYPEYEAWLNEFWQTTLNKVYDALTPGGCFAVNIQDVKLGSKTYPLVDDTKKLAADIGYVEGEQLSMRFTSFGQGLDKVKSEPIMVFVKQ